jgi:LmbE family N-acetylglucosaminyl deacetylase
MKTILAVSPHLDDAVLSAGARLNSLSRAGHDVVVLTVFAGIPEPPFSQTASQVHQQWGLASNQIATRRDEDRRAMDHLGLGILHADFLDAIYRRRLDGSWLMAGNHPPSHYADYPEPELDATLGKDIATAIHMLAPDRVLTCAAVGNHVDHRRTRDAVIRAADGTGITVQLWEDMPYGLWTQRLPPLPGSKTVLTRLAEPAGDAAWRAKCHAIELYASQQPMLWQGRPFRPLLSSHARAIAARHGLSTWAEAFWGIERDTADFSPTSPTPGAGQGSGPAPRALA